MFTTMIYVMTKLNLDGKPSSTDAGASTAKQKVDGKPSSTDAGASTAKQKAQEENIKMCWTHGYSTYENGTQGFLLILRCSNNKAVSAADAEALKEFFPEKHYIHQDNDCESIDDMIANLGKAKQTLKTEKDIYCFVCAILGNGHKGIIDLTEGEYKIEDIRKTFNNDLDSPYFTGRPKVFLIQAGQGYNLQKSSIKFADSEIAVHVDADALIAYASTPDYAAFESDKGSYFIQTCVEVFKSKHSSCHLEEMMVIVKEQMSCYRFRLKEPLQQADVRDVRDKKHPYYGTFTQMPCVWTTLTRFLYFKSPD